MSTHSPQSDLAAVELLHTAYNGLRDQTAKIIIGLEDVTEQIFITLMCRGHCILEGVPGLAKTRLISTLASLTTLSFRRIQFTPDLMPADITGSDVLEQDPASGQRVFRFIPGPIFGQVILADEINRTPPKTQSALLEAMEERQLTIGGRTYPLPNPFFVLATQNPLEQEGTYPLPEAQLDRFMLKVVLNSQQVFAMLVITVQQDKLHHSQLSCSHRQRLVHSQLNRHPPLAGYTAR
jgi:MoxR-like ATPase